MLSELSLSDSKGALYRRSACRLCDSVHLELVLKLTPTPPANAFVSREHAHGKQEVYPLDLYFCLSCGHLQLLDVVNPEVLFRDYVYVSSTSPVFVDHFRKYVDEIVEFLKPPPDSLAVEIGSNDGTMLKFFKAKSLRVLGIDPAREIARQATESGIPTWSTFFTEDLARQIKNEFGPAAVIVANNVFAHIDDLVGVTRGIRELLIGCGVFVFEVSYLVDVIQKTLFDTIYHEHLDYHCLKPLQAFFRRFDLELFKAERVPTHGGSMRCFVQLSQGPHPISPSVAQSVDQEIKLGLDQAQTFRDFSKKIELIKDDLGRCLRELKKQGKKIAGYGAPAKATTLLYHFSLNDTLDFIVDDSPLKQNLLTPGHHLPVLPSKAIYEQKPDYLLILAWNFADSIIQNHKKFLDNGGHFIVPLPEVAIV